MRSDCHLAAHFLILALAPSSVLRPKNARPLLPRWRGLVPGAAGVAVCSDARHHYAAVFHPAAGAAGGAIVFNRTVDDLSTSLS